MRREGGIRKPNAANPAQKREKTVRIPARHGAYKHDQYDGQAAIKPPDVWFAVLHSKNWRSATMLFRQRFEVESSYMDAQGSAWKRMEAFFAVSISRSTEGAQS